MCCLPCLFSLDSGAPKITPPVNPLQASLCPLGHAPSCLLLVAEVFDQLHFMNAVEGEPLHAGHNAYEPLAFLDFLPFHLRRVLLRRVDKSFLGGVLNHNDVPIWSRKPQSYCRTTRLPTCSRIEFVGIPKCAGNHRLFLQKTVARDTPSRDIVITEMREEQGHLFSAHISIYVLFTKVFIDRVCCVREDFPQRKAVIRFFF